MLLVLFVISICFMSCDRDGECWKEVRRLDEKTNAIHKEKGLALNEKINKVKRWGDSLRSSPCDACSVASPEPSEYFLLLLSE